METRKQVIGFHALQDGRFVKMYNQVVEIVDNESIISIEMKLTPTRLIYTGIIELTKEKIILLYSSYANDSLLALLDLNKVCCVSTQLINRTLNFCSSLPNNKIVVGQLYGKASIYSYENDELKLEANDHLPKNLIACTVLSDKKTVLYAHLKMRGLHTLTLATDCFENRQINFDFPISCNDVKSLALLPNGDIVCWSFENKHCLHFFDANLTPHFSTQLKASTLNPLEIFHKMAILDGQYIAMIFEDKKNSRLYVEVFNRNGMKIKEVAISNRSDQLFTVIPEGPLVSCSRSGDVIIHNLGLEELQDVLSAIKSGITASNSNASMEEPARLVCEYLGLFSQKQKNTQEIIYPKQPKQLTPRF